MNISQGEIWQVEFFPQVGSEIGKIRPALVISHDMIGKLPLKTIVPITGWSKNYENYPWMIKIKNDTINMLDKLSAIDCFQVRNFSNKRFIKKIGVVDSDLLYLVHETVLKTMNPKYKIL